MTLKSFLVLPSPITQPQNRTSIKENYLNRVNQTGERWRLGRKSTLLHPDSKKEKKKPEKRRKCRNSEQTVPLALGQGETGYSKKGLAILSANRRAVATVPGRWQWSIQQWPWAITGQAPGSQKGKQSKEGVTNSLSVPPTNNNLQGCCSNSASWVLQNFSCGQIKLRTIPGRQFWKTEFPV